MAQRRSADLSLSSKITNTRRSLAMFLALDLYDLLFLAFCGLFVWFLLMVSQMDKPPGPD